MIMRYEHGDSGMHGRTGGGTTNGTARKSCIGIMEKMRMNYDSIDFSI